MPFPTDNILPGSDPSIADDDANQKYYILLHFFLTYRTEVNQLRVDTRVTELEHIPDFEKSLEKEFERREILADYWPEELEKWITEMEKKIQSVSMCDYRTDHGVLKRVYNDIRINKVLSIAEFAEPIFETYFMDLRVLQLPFPGIENITKDPLFGEAVNAVLKNIVSGVAYAVKIAKWKKILKNFKQPSELEVSIPEVNLNSLKSKILVLRELGVIEFLEEKFKNNTKLAMCLGALMKENPNSIRPVLSNLYGHTENNSNPEAIQSLENAILLFSELKCTNEILKLQAKLHKKGEKTKIEK